MSREPLPYVCEVHDMDVVPHRGPVHSVIVRAEDREGRTAPCDHLLDVREEVVGRSAGVDGGLPEAAAGVVGDGVEVAQEHDGPLGVRLGHVAEHVLNESLGAPVWGDGPERVALVDGERLWVFGVKHRHQADLHRWSSMRRGFG